MVGCSVYCGGCAGGGAPSWGASLLRAGFWELDIGAAKLKGVSQICAKK
jgi:hypothetical protein